MNRYKRFIKRWIPTGSPLWYFYRYGKSWGEHLAGNKRRPIRPLSYVVNNNILLEEQKAIYFYIPKVACTSLKTVFSEFCDCGAKGQGDHIEEIHKLNFPAAKKYKIHKKYQDYFRFCFVRNPWDRLVSCYKDKLNFEPDHVYSRYENSFESYLKELDLYKDDLSFGEFVEVVAQIPDDKAEGHIRSQHTYIHDQRGNLLVDYIGYLENLSEDLTTIQNKLGVEFTMPKLRQTTRKKYLDYYDDRTIEIVAQRYSKDIELFKYKYDGDGVTVQSDILAK